jgi:hypothetical protein
MTREYNKTMTSDVPSAPVSAPASHKIGLYVTNLEDGKPFSKIRFLQEDSDHNGLPDLLPPPEDTLPLIGTENEQRGMPALLPRSPNPGGAFPTDRTMPIVLEIGEAYPPDRTIPHCSGDRGGDYRSCNRGGYQLYTTTGSSANQPWT